jgi:mitogen-activated protein kinase kinase kinase
MSTLEYNSRGARFPKSKPTTSANDPPSSRRDTKSAIMHVATELSNQSGSGSSGESDAEHFRRGSDDDIDPADGQYGFAPPVVTTPLEDTTLQNSGMFGWNSATSAGSKSRLSVGSAGSPPDSSVQIQTNGIGSGRPMRPSAVRTPSNAYNPARRPHQFSINTTRHRNSSVTRRRNPNAEYRAQEKAYVQRIRQDAPHQDEFFDAELRTPSLDYSSESDTDEDSPATAEYLDNDPYDQETLLYYGNDEMLPSVEELKIPANRERLEWHSMLAAVLTGDVVKQEKKRVMGGTQEDGDVSLRTEMWMGIRAKVCGRTLQAQRRMVEDGRQKVKGIIEAVIAFEVAGETETGRTAAQQVDDVVAKIEKIESLYPTHRALVEAHPRAGSPAYIEACDAVIAWHNTTELINRELNILRAWVGNDELDFIKPKIRSGNDNHLSDESSFIDRLLKEDGLKTLLSKESLLESLHMVITKAKSTFIANAEAFLDRHLPPFIEEVLTLINFPSRLVQEVIRVRLSYAKKIKDPAQQGSIIADQMISQFKMLLNLGVRVREAYDMISQPEPGWEPPPCIEENFDMVVLDSLKFYFKIMNWKLSANKNTFKEAEILEQEWEFLNKLGRHLEGGDVEVAEQFR